MAGGQAGGVGGAASPDARELSEERVRVGEEGRPADGEEEEEEEEGEEQREAADRPLPCKRGSLLWRSRPCVLASRSEGTPGSRTPLESGPTFEARVSVTSDSPASAFLAFFDVGLEDRVVAMTNLHAEERRRAGRGGLAGWKPMDRAAFRAYVGLLVLAGVHRSRGEACESLWHPETGRRVFRETMTLKAFRAYSSAMRFDERASRDARRSGAGVGGGEYKMAPIKEVWDAWSRRLPELYTPGSEITVDERLVPFKGRCPFRQYMPSKPAKYGIKLWVACDAGSSYAWKMIVYTGKCHKLAPPEKNLAARVVLELTRGLEGEGGRNVTFDNFFTSYQLARGLLLDRGLTCLGTIRANRPELPSELLELRGRRVNSSRFAFSRRAADDSPGARPVPATVVSYVAKKNKNVLLLTTCRAHLGGAELSDRADRKPRALLHYNRTKGGVDNLDKVLGTYSCRRRTSRWPMALFHNMVDVSAYNAFVLWRELRPEWMAGKLNRRRLFLEQLGRELAAPLAMRNASEEPGVRGGGEDDTAEVDGDTGEDDADAGDAGDKSKPDDSRRFAEDAQLERAPETLAASKRKRCAICPRSKDSKTRTRCLGCGVHVCGRCSRIYCPKCPGR